jgi:hypothetical protein
VGGVRRFQDPKAVFAPLNLRVGPGHAVHQHGVALDPKVFVGAVHGLPDRPEQTIGYDELYMLLDPGQRQLIFRPVFQDVEAEKPHVEVAPRGVQGVVVVPLRRPDAVLHVRVAVFPARAGVEHVGPETGGVRRGDPDVQVNNGMPGQRNRGEGATSRRRMRRGAGRAVGALRDGRACRPVPWRATRGF